MLSYETHRPFYSICGIAAIYYEAEDGNFDPIPGIPKSGRLKMVLVLRFAT